MVGKKEIQTVGSVKSCKRCVKPRYLHDGSEVWIWTTSSRHYSAGDRKLGLGRDTEDT